MSWNGSRTRCLRYARQRSGMTAGCCDGIRDDRRQRQRAVMLGQQRAVMLGLVPSICCGEGCRGAVAASSGSVAVLGTGPWMTAVRRCRLAAGTGSSEMSRNGSRTRCLRCARRRSGMTAERASDSGMSARNTPGATTQLRRDLLGGGDDRAVGETALEVGHEARQFDDRFVDRLALLLQAAELLFRLVERQAHLLGVGA